MKILHTADLHLRQYEDERWEVLQGLIALAGRFVEVFVISGDLFDGRAASEHLRPRIRELFSNSGFKVVVIPGNHDRLSFEGGMYFGSDVVVLTELGKPFEYGQVRLWGLPFEPIEGGRLIRRLHSLRHRLTPDKKNILLYHGELLDTFFQREDFGEEGEGRYMPVRLSYFKDLNIDYVLAGHFHSRFDVRRLENGGYFVYPGSPVSISRRELGQRKVNVFSLGEPPEGHSLDTPHFEEKSIEFDPLMDEDPLDVVRSCIEKTHHKAKLILRIGGFIDSKEIALSESELAEKIKELVEGRCAGEDLHMEFKDIQGIVEDDLFRRFLDKLKEGRFEQAVKPRMREIAIRAMAGARQV